VPLSIRLPNRLAHLARILTALDEARRVSSADRHARGDPFEPPAGPRLDLHTGLEGLNLYGGGPEGPLPDDLSLMSLSRVEPLPDGDDALDDRSLSLPTAGRQADVSNPFAG
jgi:hypothetical protein